MVPIKKRTRQWLLLIHIVLSTGWMGAGAANVVLAVTAATTSDLALVGACYRLIERIDAALVIPLAFGSLASGVVISLATKWRLLKYWWVVVKLMLTLVVILFSTFAVGVWVEQSIDATTTSDGTSPVAIPLIWGASADLGAFLFMNWASIAKPWSTTPWYRPKPSASRSGRF